jgi:outer membrane protein OmpA-like peptidoglycan-associated protein
MALFASVSFGTAPMLRSQTDDSRHDSLTVILFPISKVKRHSNLQISAYLRALAATAKMGPKRLVLTGLADNRGSSDMNLCMAKQRAESVQHELIKLGAPTDSIEIATSIKPAVVLPAVTDDSVEGRQRNRRVELSFTLMVFASAGSHRQQAALIACTPCL